MATLCPRPDAPTLLRKLAEAPAARVEARSAAASARSSPVVVPAGMAPPPPAARTVVQPLAPERYKLQVTISRTTHDKLRRAQDFMRHTVPSGDAAIILDRALDLLLANLERNRIAAAARPRSEQPAGAGSPHIPAAVRRLVWQLRTCELGPDRVVIRPLAACPPKPKAKVGLSGMMLDALKSWNSDSR